MKYRVCMNLKPVVLALLIVVLNSFPILQTKICYGVSHSSTITDNLYSSVVVITEKKLKTSIWDTLIFATALAVQSPIVPAPYHTEKALGTGFQTKWGVVTNSHVMDDRTKAVLTTFHRSHYSIKKINRSKDKYIPIPKLIQTATKEATVYDWGDLDIDMALIDVKIPGAFPLPLAREVKIDEPVITLGHPESRKFTPAIGKVTRIYKYGETKYIELFIKSAKGSSGSPVMNMKGEVVGILFAGVPGLDVAEAVHVEELRKAIGLPNYNVPKNNYSPEKDQQKVLRDSPITVFATNSSNVFHKRDCSKLYASEGLIKFDTQKKASKAGCLPCNYCRP